MRAIGLAAFRFVLPAIVLWAPMCLPARAQTAATSVAIDAAKPGPAINPFMYGQFIEHMGRCIHGGIWAEMLFDRKFLLEPGKSWQTVTPEGADFDAVHDTAGAYCG